MNSASRQSENFSIDSCSCSSVSKQKLHNLGNSSYFDSVLLLFDSLFVLAKSIRRYTMGQWDNTQGSPVRCGLHCNILGANKNYDFFVWPLCAGGCNIFNSAVFLSNPNPGVIITMVSATCAFCCQIFFVLMSLVTKLRLPLEHLSHGPRLE